MSKVYLSSTLLDLREERQAVSDWLIAAGFQPVHSYVADSETVRDSCLDDIAGCDLYVLLLGHRYGSQPSKRNPKQASITQLEFRRAGKLRLPRLAFLRSSVPDIHLSDLNDPARSPLVLAFRQEVAETLRPAEFKDKAELLAALGAAMQQHVMKLLRERDALAAGHQQRIVELEQELEKTRAEAVSRVLDQSGRPDAPDLALQARAALLKGDTALAETLLKHGEDAAAAAAQEKQAEAAQLAREIAALAVGRDSQTALAALERAARYQPEDFWTWIQLGDAQAVLGKSASALVSFQTAQALAQHRLDREPADTPSHLAAQRDLSVSHERIGDVLQAQGDGPGALAAFRLSLGIRETLAARDPANTQWQRDLSVSHQKIGNMLQVQGDGPGALAAFRLSLGIRETLAAHDPANTEWQRDLSVSHNKIGDVLQAQGDGPGALAAFRLSLGIREALAASAPANTQWQRDLSVSHNKIGDVLQAQGDGPGALVAYRLSLGIREILAARDPANTEWQRDLSVSHIKIGNVLQAQGDGPGALAAFRLSLGIHEALAARDPANAQWQVDQAVSMARLGTSASLGVDQRRLHLERGRALLTTLQSQGRLLPNQDWIGWFDQQLAALK
jgi:tetratricopeptide (TPR) repeat protein